MTTMHEGSHRIPEWDMTDRLNKSLKSAGISVATAATYFDVHRNTVSGWLHGRINPDIRTLRLWALMTGVPFEWLKDGIEPHHPGGPDDGATGQTSQPTDLDTRRRRPAPAFQRLCAG